jgi:hypothetical protein
MTNKLKIQAAVLRWHTAHIYRLEIGAKQRRYQLDQKQRKGFGGSDLSTSRCLTAAKRIELAALRTLAKERARVRGSHIDDAAEIDMPVLLTCEQLTDSTR